MITMPHGRTRHYKGMNTADEKKILIGTEHLSQWHRQQQQQQSDLVGRQAVAAERAHHVCDARGG